MRLKKLLIQNLGSISYLFITAVLPVTVSSFLTVYIINNESIFHHFGVQEWAVVFTISTFTMAFALTPTTFIALTCGYFLGIKCVPWLIISYGIASLIGYHIAKFIGGQSLKNTISNSSKLSIVVTGIKEYEYLVIFLTRISPILPFALINGVLGMLECNLKKFIIAGTIGMLPRTLLSIYIGVEVNNIVEIFKSGKSMTISQLVFYILLAISILGMFWIFGKIAKKLQAKVR
jgi:uncharacterized membrane protein YdjX (TVP38/TMEM64 family)